MAHSTTYDVVMYAKRNYHVSLIHMVEILNKDVVIKNTCQETMKKVDMNSNIFNYAGVFYSFAYFANSS